jgi:hypothetical protein
MVSERYEEEEVGDNLTVLTVAGVALSVEDPDWVLRGMNNDRGRPAYWRGCGSYMARGSVVVARSERTYPFGQYDASTVCRCFP